MSDKITLDRETFKALAADTRVDILKKLAEHKLTLTDIAQDMEMSPSTIKEHLDKLVEVGLIEQEDKGMKWKYYRLTDKGKNIISPYETKVWILLGTSLLVLAGSALSLASKVTTMMTFSASKAVAGPSAPTANLMLAGVAENAIGVASNTTMPAEATSTTQQAVSITLYEAAGEGGRMLSGGVENANETLRNAADSYINSAGHERVAAAYSNIVNETTTPGPMMLKQAVETTTTLAHATSSTVQATTATLQHVTSTTLAQLMEATKASGPGTPYLEMILLSLSLVVAGGCVGYLLRKRLKVD
jgi:DNA-binding transcriptional ArsR family regulator